MRFRALLFNCAFNYATTDAFIAIVKHCVLTFCDCPLLFIKGNYNTVFCAVFTNDFNSTALLWLTVTELCSAMEFLVFWGVWYPIASIHSKA